jgi:hypothetical protein
MHHSGRRRHGGSDCGAHIPKGPSSPKLPKLRATSTPEREHALADTGRAELIR